MAAIEIYDTSKSLKQTENVPLNVDNRWHMNANKNRSDEKFETVKITEPWRQTVNSVHISRSAHIPCIHMETFWTNTYLNN